MWLSLASGLCEPPPTMPCVLSGSIMTSETMSCGCDRSRYSSKVALAGTFRGAFAVVTAFSFPVAWQIIEFKLNEMTVIFFALWNCKWNSQAESYFCCS